MLQIGIPFRNRSKSLFTKKQVSDQVKLHDSRSSLNIKRNKNQHSTVQAFLSKQNQGDSMRIRCAYCKEQHYSASCEKVTDLQQRKDILRRNKRCFICLRIGHVSQECQNLKMWPPTSSIDFSRGNPPSHHIQRKRPRIPTIKQGLVTHLKLQQLQVQLAHQ